jgi:hypothetical protein
MQSFLGGSIDGAKIVNVPRPLCLRSSIRQLRATHDCRQLFNLVGVLGPSKLQFMLTSFWSQILPSTGKKSQMAPSSVPDELRREGCGWPLTALERIVVVMQSILLYSCYLLSKLLVVNDSIQDSGRHRHRPAKLPDYCQEHRPLAGLKPGAHEAVTSKGDIVDRCRQGSSPV